MTANMMGGAEIDASGELKTPNATKTYYLAKDGTLTEDGDEAYVLQVTATNDSSTKECAASVGCTKGNQFVGSGTVGHTEGSLIKVKYTKPAPAEGSNPAVEGGWTLELGAKE